jgi:hypothetical protein
MEDQDLLMLLTSNYYSKYHTSLVNNILMLLMCSKMILFSAITIKFCNFPAAKKGVKSFHCYTNIYFVFPL